MNLLKKIQKPDVQISSLILLFGLLLVFIPHFSHLPLWLNIVISIFLIWRAAFELKFCPIPNKIILFILTIMLLIGIVFSYHTLIGRNAGSAMLLGLLSLKLFEIKSFRDIALIINLALFSIVINFLFNQSIAIAFIMILALIFLFTALIGFQHNYKDLNKSNPVPINYIQENEKKHLKLAFKMLMQAVPFAIVLFLLFPRVNGPLWGLPEDAFSGTTGLSDKMSPGRISQLSDDNSVAFRVKFSSVIPPSTKLYWRGPVMWNFDGYNWNAPITDRLAISGFQFTGTGSITQYTITLQPHNSFWMFALDIPATLPKKAQLTVDMQILSLLPIQKLQRYSLNSYTNYLLPANPKIDMSRYLKLPDSFSNQIGSNLYQSRRLIKQLKDSTDPEKTISNVLNYFATQDFYYSRTPPLLHNNPVDEFLFKTKRGYCEHYASSFTVLMRLAGLPARVVTGYQGGEINPIDGYMTIRQSDAHAWSEVFLEKKGWVRIDPTAYIPPANIENSDDARRLNSNLKKSNQLFKTNWFSKQIKKIRYTLDAINNRWNQWVLGYDNKRQKAFFKALGIPDISWQGLSQLLFSILGVLTAILAWVVFSNKTTSKDPIQYFYLKFLKRLKKYDLIKNPTEGANDFCCRAIKKVPQQKQHIQKITFLYQELRYSFSDNNKFILFKNLVRKKF